MSSRVGASFMARLRLLKSALLTVFILWVVGCFAFFLSGFLTLQFGAPRWLPLPWSDFTNFVESPDGHVFVNLCFYSRVLSYDRKGRFKASYHYPPGGTGAEARRLSQCRWVLALEGGELP